MVNPSVILKSAPGYVWAPPVNLADCRCGGNIVIGGRTDRPTKLHGGVAKEWPFAKYPCVAAAHSFEVSGIAMLDSHATVLDLGVGFGLTNHVYVGLRLLWARA